MLFKLVILILYSSLHLSFSKVASRISSFNFDISSVNLDISVSCCIFNWATSFLLANDSASIFSNLDNLSFNSLISILQLSFIFLLESLQVDNCIFKLEIWTVYSSVNLIILALILLFSSSNFLIVSSDTCGLIGGLIGWSDFKLDNNNLVASNSTCFSFKRSFNSIIWLL